MEGLPAVAIALDEDSLVLNVVILERQALAPVDVEPHPRRPAL